MLTLEKPTAGGRLAGRMKRSVSTMMRGARSGKLSRTDNGSAKLTPATAGRPARICRVVVVPAGNPRMQIPPFSRTTATRGRAGIISTHVLA